jgi:type I restriction enzyme S subunit
MLFITSKNVKNGFLDVSQPKYLSIDFHDKLKRSKIKKGDILINLVGASIGRSCRVDRNLGPTNINQAVSLFRVNKGICGKYVAFYFQAPSTILRILWMQVDAARPNISLTDLRSFLVPLPPLPEQKKIAEILSTWDAAIEQTRRLINAKKRRKKALMQQLLTGKKRLPGFAKTKGRNSYRFFDLPTDWKCPRIREVAEESSERNRQRDKLTVLSCSKHLGFVESSEYFGKQIFSEDTSNYKVIRRGCFGYPSNHIEEGSIGLLINHKIGMVSPIYTVFLCNENVVPEFLFALFKSDTYRHIFSISTNASVDRRGSLRWREFSLIQVPNPSKEEQHVIVDVLQTADDEINQVKAKLKALEKQKRGLMQKLLTGEVRVK